MNKTVFLFSGQGSQYVGMGQELLAYNPACERIYEAGSDILGFDLKTACFQGTEPALAQTKIAQPAIFATSLVALECLKGNNDFLPEAVAGHSLGEYAAMVASGILSMEDGFQVIKRRSEAMQRCAENQNGAMFAILGKTSREIEAVCEKTEGYVVPVNYNAPLQTVIAGELDACEAAANSLISLGAKAVRLGVSAAFHSKLMQPAADEFKASLSDISFEYAYIDFYSNVTAKRLQNFADMPALLAKHIVSPVKFTEELQTIQAEGADQFIELGPNKVLTGLVKKTLKGVAAYNVENRKTLDKLLSKD